MADINALEDYNLSRQQYCHLSSGYEYPTKERLQEDQLTFYTGYILIALLNFVVRYCQFLLCSVDSLTMMKLRMNIPNQDFAFRFQISPPTVTRVYSRSVLELCTID